MVLRNHVEWALYCCVTLATLPSEQYVSTRALAEFYRLPKTYLHKALQRLSNASIVETTVGPSGGYRLAKHATCLSVLEILEAVDGPGPLYVSSDIHLCLPFPNRHLLDERTMVDRVMLKAEERWRQALREVSLFDLAQSFEREFGIEHWRKNLLSLTGQGQA